MKSELLSGLKVPSAEELAFMAKSSHAPANAEPGITPVAGICLASPECAGPKEH